MHVPVALLSEASRGLRQCQFRQGGGRILRHPDCGQDSGRKRPMGSGTWSSSATRIRFQPRRKILTCLGRWHAPSSLAGARAVTCRTELAGIVSSASPPTLSSHNRHSDGQPQACGPLRLAHVGALPLPAGAFGILKPCSIQARNPYQQVVLASGSRSVRSNHGSLYPASQQASSVQYS